MSLALTVSTWSKIQTAPQVREVSGGVIVGLGAASETGFDIASDRIARPAMEAALARIDIEDAPRSISAAFRTGAAVIDTIAPYDEADILGGPELPSMDLLIAACAGEQAMIAWIGGAKAFLVREGAVRAETIEHTARRDPIKRAQSAELLEHLGMLDMPMRLLTRKGGEPSGVTWSLRQEDQVVLISNCLGRRAGWMSGLPEEIARARGDAQMWGQLAERDFERRRSRKRSWSAGSKLIGAIAVIEVIEVRAR